MKNDLAEMRPNPNTEPTANAMRAAVIINTKTDAILRHMGIDPGTLGDSQHRLTAKIIDVHAAIPELLETLSMVRKTLALQLDFWTTASAKTNTELARDMEDACRLSIAAIDQTTSL